MIQSDRSDVVSSRERGDSLSDDQSVSRRAALRRLGITVSAGFLGLIAADDAVRAVAVGLARQKRMSAIASTLARQFSDAGVAHAAALQDPNCGVAVSVPPMCLFDFMGNPIGQCRCNPYNAPNRGCTQPSDCMDCMTVADFRFCECQQALDNAYPDCADCVGNPLGDPSCVAFNTGIGACYAAYLNDTANC